MNGPNRTPRTRALGALTLGLLAALVVALAAPPAAAQGRRGPLVVLGLRAPDGDDSIATNATNALRRAARDAGFTVPDDSPPLEQSMELFGCAEPLTAQCLQQIANDAHATRMIYGAVRREPAARRNANAPVNIEVRVFDPSATPPVSEPQTVTNLARGVANDADQLREQAQRLLNGLLPPPVVNPQQTNVGNPVEFRPVQGPAVPIRRYIGIGVAGAGVIAVGLGVVFGVQWLGLNGEAQQENSAWRRYQPFSPNDMRTRDSGAICNEARNNQTGMLTNYMGADLMGTPAPMAPARSEVLRFCDGHSSLQAMEWGFIAGGAALIAAGLVLILTDNTPAAAPAAAAPAQGAAARARRLQAARPRFDFAPQMTPGYQGATFQLQF